jgi:hypothetical protein
MNTSTRSSRKFSVKNTFLAISIVGALGVSLIAKAAGAGNSPVTSVIAQAWGGTGGAGVGFIVIAVAAGQPACAAPGRFAVDLGLPAGRTLYATALAAFHAGGSMTLSGSGLCKLSATAEDLVWGSLP